MIRIAVVRLGQGLVAVLLASIAIFFMMRLIPGDPAAVVAGADASEETIAAVRTELGLDRPIIVQYLAWLGSVLTGSLGESYTARSPVADLIAPTIAPTVWLMAGGVVLAVVVAFLIGVPAALSKRRWVEATLMSGAAVLYGAPVFWVGLLVVLVFAVNLGLLPAGGFVNPLDSFTYGIQSLILPWLVLGTAMGASLSRFVRSSFAEVLESDYVRMARSKGGGNWHVIAHHGVRNALIPVITVYGIAFAGLLGGSVVIEQVFAWPGTGSLMLNAVNSRDYPTVQVILLLYVAIFVFINFLTDLSYSIIDPRIRVEGRRPR